MLSKKGNNKHAEIRKITTELLLPLVSIDSCPFNPTGLAVFVV
jgi:hypothetical protein